jgi:RNA polymerase sigma factor (sigma-70 family)
MPQENLSFIVQQLRRLAGSGAGEQRGDAELLERYVGYGEHAAFEALVRRHGPLVWAVCRRVLGRDQDAEDVFQAAFLVLAQKAGSIRKRHSIASWLYGVAYRLARKCQSEQERRRVHEKQAASVPPADPAREAATREVARAVTQEVERLPERYRPAVVLCYLAGRTREQAAAELGWPLGTLKTRLRRALGLLEKRLRRRGLGLTVALEALACAEAPAQTVLPLALLQLGAAAGLPAVSSATTMPVAANALRLARPTLSGIFLTRLRSLAFLLIAGLVLGGGSTLALHLRAKHEPEEEGAFEARRLTVPPIAASQPLFSAAKTQLPPKALARLGSMAFLHRGGVRTLLFGPQGKTLLSGHPGQPMQLWNADTGEEMRRFRGHESDAQRGPFYMAMSPDGKRVAARSHADKMVHVWEAASGKELARFAPGSDSACQFCAGGEIIASWMDQTGRSGLGCWDAAGNHLRDIPGVGPPALIFSAADGSTLATMAPEPPEPPLPDAPDPFSRRPAKPAAIHVWDSASGRALSRIGYENGIAGDQVVLSADGKFLLTKDRGGRLEVREAGSGAVRHSGQIAGWPCALSADADTLAVVETSSFGGTIVLWDLALGAELRRLSRPGLRDRNMELAFSPDGKVLAASGDSARLHLWEVASGKERFPSLGHEGSVNLIAFSPDGTRLVSSGQDGTLRTWDIARRQQLSLCEVKDYQVPVAMPDGQVLVWHRGAADFRLQDPAGRRAPLAFPLSGKPPPESVRVMRDGRLLVFSGSSATLWDAAIGQCRGRLIIKRPQRSAILSGAVLSADTVAVLLWEEPSEYRILLWNPGTPDQYVEREAQTQKNQLLLGSMFSPDGTTWAAVPADRSRVAVWETATGRCVFNEKCFAVSRDPPVLGFSAGGRYLAVAGGGAEGDGFVQIWDTAKKREACHLDQLSGEVTSLAFASDGRTLATGFSNGDLLLWDLVALGAAAEDAQQE